MFRRSSEVERLSLTVEDYDRVKKMIISMGGGHFTNPTPEMVMDFCVAEERLAADKRAADRIRHATYWLVFATVVLAGATVALVIATINSSG